MDVKELSRRRVREMLNRWGSANRFCAEKREELNKYQEELNRIREASGVSYSESRNNNISDPTYKKAAKVLTVEEAYSKYIADITQQIGNRLAEKTTIDHVVNLLEPHKSDIISLYYKALKGSRSWDIVSMQVGYTPEHCRKLEIQAIDEIMQNLLKVDTN